MFEEASHASKQLSKMTARLDPECMINSKDNVEFEDFNQIENPKKKMLLGNLFQPELLFIPHKTNNYGNHSEIFMSESDKPPNEEVLSVFWKR
jgi:hypothetical protein